MTPEESIVDFLLKYIERENWNIPNDIIKFIKTRHRKEIQEAYHNGYHDYLKDVINKNYYNEKFKQFNMISKIDYEINYNDINTKLLGVGQRIFNYILISNNNIIYIGCSSNLYKRLYQHKRNKSFDKILLIEFENKKDAFNNENCLIKKYLPILNYNQNQTLK